MVDAAYLLLLPLLASFPGEPLVLSPPPKLLLLGRYLLQQMHTHSSLIGSAIQCYVVEQTLMLT